jgi:hypothetical protein
MSAPSRRSTELRATSWKRAEGVPLGAKGLEYRNLFVNGDCIACYIYLTDETMNLALYQAFASPRNGRSGRQASRHDR